MHEARNKLLRLTYTSMYEQMEAHILWICCIFFNSFTYGLDFNSLFNIKIQLTVTASCVPFVLPFFSLLKTVQTLTVSQKFCARQIL